MGGASRRAYALAAYGAMVADDLRREPYLAALRASVRPEDVVLDLGCGYGALGFAALALGARRVHAIDVGPATRVARHIAADSGWADRFVVHTGLIEDLAPPERCDVLVSDLRGTLPLHTGNLTAQADARRRWLVDGAREVPVRDRIFIAPVRDERQWRGLVAPWGAHAFGADMRPASRALAVGMHALTNPAETILAPGQVVADIAYTAPADRYGASVSFSDMPPGPLHGLRVWFEATLVEGIGFHTGPGSATSVYGRPFIPFPEPFDLTPGAAVHAKLEARLVASDWVWRWDVRALDASGSTLGTVCGTSLDGCQVDPDALRRREAQATPRCSPLGACTAEVLRAMDGATSVEAIAESLLARHPGQFRDLDAAWTFVGDVIDRHAE